MAQNLKTSISLNAINTLLPTLPPIPSSALLSILPSTNLSTLSSPLSSTISHSIQPTGSHVLSKLTSFFPSPLTSTLSSPLPSTNIVSSLSRKCDLQHDDVYRKMEGLLGRMQERKTGVCVKNVKTLLSNIPSVFTGVDLVSWMVRNLQCAPGTNEALHLAQMMTAHGYIFPINHNILIFKNDHTYYRFQTCFFWPSMYSEPEDIDYATHLCKRTIQNKQRLELADYEAENFAKLQNKFSRQWEFISLQAETQSKLDKRRDKLERLIFDSQEKAFWNVHRPAPGCVNTTEVDIKKTYRSLCTRSKIPNKGIYSVFGGTISPNLLETNHLPLSHHVEVFKQQVEYLKMSLSRSRIKVSKVAESFQMFSEQFYDHDVLSNNTLEVTNPWITDNSDLWDNENSLRTISRRRVKKWSLGIRELLKDVAGRTHFMTFLEKEFSAENLKFWEACENMKNIPMSQVQANVVKIYDEYIGPGAKNAVNIDWRVLEKVKEKLQTHCGRNSFEDAEEQILHLMKNDSYSRYIRSDFYKDFLATAKIKPSKKKFTGEVRRLRKLTTSKSQPILES